MTKSSPKIGGRLASKGDDEIDSLRLFVRLIDADTTQQSFGA